MLQHNTTIYNKVKGFNSPEKYDVFDENIN